MLVSGALGFGLEDSKRVSSAILGGLQGFLGVLDFLRVWWFQVLGG